MLLLGDPDSPAAWVGEQPGLGVGDASVAAIIDRTERTSEQGDLDAIRQATLWGECGETDT